MGSYLDNGKNQNIKNGGTRFYAIFLLNFWYVLQFASLIAFSDSFHINLRQPPFNFPPPIESIEERGVMTEVMAADLSQSLGRSITPDPTPRKVGTMFPVRILTLNCAIPCNCYPSFLHFSTYCCIHLMSSANQRNF